MPFFVVSFIVLFTGILNFFLLIEKPEDIGFKVSDDENKEDKPREKIGFLKAFLSPGIIEFILSHLLIKAVISGTYYWYPTYL